MKTNPTMQAEAVLPTRPVSENGKINILTRLAYGGGDVACNVVYGMIATLLTLFYTDYAGVSVATVGLVMLISRFLTAARMLSWASLWTAAIPNGDSPVRGSCGCRCRMR